MARSIEEILYDAIVELSYVQAAEDHSQCASAKGEALVNEGMEALKVKDLSAEKWSEAKRV
jgi:hypothetical protein